MGFFRNFLTSTTGKNIFAYAAIYYKKNNPDSKILNTLCNSLDTDSKAIYDGELEMGNSVIDMIKKDLYTKLVRNYIDFLSN